jgi:hypothetical protein
MIQDTRYQKFKKEVEYKLRNGPLNIQEIYKRIQRKYPTDCDDKEPCEHKGNFYQYGEWKHLVRSALQGLQKEHVVRYDSKNDKWVHR